MFVYCCDGNEKVGRPICGENLPLPSEDTGYIGTDTDVQNAVMRAAHREKICPNFQPEEASDPATNAKRGLKERAGFLTYKRAKKVHVPLQTIPGQRMR